MCVSYKIIFIYLDINWYWSTINLYPINLIFYSIKLFDKVYNRTIWIIKMNSKWDQNAWTIPIEDVSKIKKDYYKNNKGHYFNEMISYFIWFQFPMFTEYFHVEPNRQENGYFKICEFYYYHLYQLINSIYL